MTQVLDLVYKKIKKSQSAKASKTLYFKNKIQIYKGIETNILPAFQSSPSSKA